MKHAFLVLFVCFSAGIIAQDTIVRIDSSRIVAKITGISDTKISYKRYNDPDGPTYETSRRNVARIAYANGLRERYGKTESEELSPAGKNIISLTTTDVVAGVITLNYERMIGGCIGVRAVASTGILGLTGKTADYSGGTYYYNRYKIFSAGMDVHYYAYRGTKFSWYTGALIEYGQVRKREYFWEWPPYPPVNNVAEYYFGGITNGVKISATEHVELDMFCSLGWRNNLNGGWSDYSGRFGFSIGYRF